jgi:hypothetical protein
MMQKFEMSMMGE